jgi:hypothetical protein
MWHDVRNLLVKYPAGWMNRNQYSENSFCLLVKKFFNAVPKPNSSVRQILPLASFLCLVSIINTLNILHFFKHFMTMY